MLVARNNFFTGSPPPPTITGFSPSSLSNGGGGVTISGSNFINGATTVTVAGNQYATTVNSTSSLSVGFPTLGRGTYTVTVTTPGGSVSSSFTYYWTPYISYITPSSVYYDYASGYTIVGGRFSSSAASSVYVSNGGYYGISIANDGQLSFNPGALATGNYTAYVVAPDGWSGGVGFSTSWYPAPSISSVSDGRGGNGAQTGSTITLSGSNFTGASVSIGGTAVSASVSDTSISFSCPNLSTDGTKTITVTTARSGNQSASTSVYFWGAKASATTNYTSGSGSYSIPGWANSVDCIALGGGQGGGIAAAVTGRGGQKGSWSGVSFARSSNWATTSLSYSVGGGGTRGTTWPNPGGNGGTSTAGSASGAGGSGDTGAFMGAGSGNFTYNGVTYTGSAATTTGGQNGNPPGGGGAGGNIIGGAGGLGAAGTVYFRAIQ